MSNPKNYKLYLSLPLLFDRITGTLDTVSLGTGKETIEQFEKGTNYPNSKKGEPVPHEPPRFRRP